MTAVSLAEHDFITLDALIPSYSQNYTQLWRILMIAENSYETFQNYSAHETCKHWSFIGEIID